MAAALEKTAGEIRQASGRKVLAIAADLTKEADAKKFADEVMKKYGSYCWSDRNRREWNLKGNPAKRWVPNDYDKPDAALLEVWVRPDKTLHGHCSRNRFRWVGDETLKTSLHALAVEWINMLDSRASDLSGLDNVTAMQPCSTGTS